MIQDPDRVVLFDEVLAVEATVEFGEEHEEWLARPDWSTSRDLPCPDTNVF